MGQEVVESSSAFDAIDLVRVKDTSGHATAVSSSALHGSIGLEVVVLPAQSLRGRQCIPINRSYPVAVGVRPECLEFILETHLEGYYAPIFEGRVESLASIWYQITADNTVIEDDYTRAEQTSSFDNLLSFYDKKLSSKITELRNYKDIDYSDKLADRLTELVGLGYEEEFDQVPIKIESLSNFISFIKSNISIKCPNIVLTPSREIQAQWGKAKDKKLVVVFLGGGEINFVLFVRNKISLSKIDRHAITTTVDMLLDIIKPSGAHGWVLNTKHG